MTPRYHVTQGSRWPSGDYRAAAVLRLEPREFAAPFGIRFARGVDDLDYYRAVTVQLASGRRVEFVQYRGNRDYGTEVLIDAAEDPGEALVDVLSALGLSADVVSWAPEPVRHERPSAAVTA